MAASLFVDGIYGASQSREAGLSQVPLTSADNFTTQALVAPIRAGQCSYLKHVVGRLQGSWNAILGVHVHRNASKSAALTAAFIGAHVTTGYIGPTAGCLPSLTRLAGATPGTTNGPNTTLALGLGQSIGNATLAACSNNLGSTVFTNFFAIQLQTTPSTISSGVASNTLRIIVDEN